MKLRAVVFDLYGTLLQVGPPPADAAARWEQIWREVLGTPPRLDLAEFNERCRRAVAAEHAAARATGIAYPEVYWPAIVTAVLPEIGHLPARDRADLPFCRAGLLHTTKLMPGAGAALHAARHANLRLGLASNCQPYSLHELEAGLAEAGLSRAIFDPQLTFLSFAHGFSKPDPHVFQLLNARLRQLDLPLAEVVMVGDRSDNDLEPARARGWQTFSIVPDPAIRWGQLAALVRHAIPP